MFSFLRTSDSTSGTVDVKPVLQWIAYTKGWMPSNETIGDVQFGYEVTSSSGGLDFTTNNLTINGGRPRPAPGSVAVDHLVGDLREELSGRGAASHTAVAVGLARDLDPQEHLGASAQLGGGSDTAA